MLTFRRYLILMVLLTLGLVGCLSAVGSSPTHPVTINAKKTATISTVGSKKPPQTHAAGIHPAARREELTRLSSLLKFTVIGRDGVALGQVSDFIINTCETYIIYFTVAPDASLKLAAGSHLVIPFEVVTINNGVLDAAGHTISIYMNPSQVAAAPVFADPLVLLPYKPWEDTVRTYWLQVARVSHLTSECKAGGSNSANAVHKIAYATQLIGAALKDGNHNLLGTVQDAILEPESGKLGFYVVKLLNGSLVMVPLGQTNIPKEALAPGKTIELVLLAETNKLLGAPQIASVEQAMKTQTQSEARQYWKK